ncbi:TonB-dependent receptor [Sphingomonas sp. ID0503]|uniref:TonB-dependent receptor n=1 Tax=Sphingomonas sp. ID0503 TaxID=3399691 RepID=UPI003AFB78BD
MKISRITALSATVALWTITAAAPAFADEAPADVASEAADEIVVTGQGQTRQVQVLSSADIALQTPGTSPLKAIDKLPGVNFQSADPFGNYEWSARISIRGFSQNQLGFTLDGVPLGDMSYGNHNGLHISRALISENTGRVEVAQGAGALSAASASNLGGTIEFFTRGPKDDLGLEANGTYGSENTFRGFARFDTGTLGDGGPKASLSYAYHNADKWKGDGEQRQHQINARIEQPLANGKVYAFVNWSDRRENDYQDLSKAMIDRLGYNWDNFAKNWDLAVLVAHIANNRGDTGAPVTDASAGTVYPSPIQTSDDAYYDAAGLRKDLLASIGWDSEVAEGLTLKGNGYYHRNRGRGMWYTPYVGTPGGAPITIRTTEYEIDRWGTTGSIAYETGPNTIEVGGWYEDNDFNQARRFYGLADTTGKPSQSPLKFPKNPLLTQWEFDFKTKTYQYFVQDTLDLGQLVVNAGWKGLKVENKADPVVQGSLTGGKIQARDWFLPKVGALYRFTDEQEVFAGYTENMRAFESSTGGPFGTTPAGFSALDLKPEKSGTWEVGLRTTSSRFQGVLAAYYVDFKDRIISFANGAGILGNPAILQNVGDVRTYGFEAAGTYRITPALSVFGSYSYNKSQYKDDVVNAAGAVVVSTDGKTVVNAPKHLAKGEITYDDKQFIARLAANYTSKRFYDYENTASVKGFVIFDATLGYRFETGFMQGITIEGTASNLFDKKYISTIGTNGFANRGDSQTLLTGAPQQFFVTLKTEF